MGYSEYLTDMLKPMGVYNLTSGCGKSELDAIGAAFDEVNSEIAFIEKETVPATAENSGLTIFERLFPITYLYTDTDKRRKAIAALIRTDDLSYTKAALESQLEACGIPGIITETDVKYTVHVHFTFGKGEPEQEDMDAALEILPAHLAVEFSRDSISWNEIESRFTTWDAFDNCGLNALEIQKLE